jgi:hypothetical protein
MQFHIVLLTHVYRVELICLHKQSTHSKKKKQKKKEKKKKKKKMGACTVL